MTQIPTRSPIALLSYYDGGELPKLLGTLKHERLPKKVPVYVGNYGISGGDAAEIHKAGAKYAPVFKVGPSDLYPRRSLTHAEAKKLGKAGHDGLTGAIPPQSRWPSLSASDRVRWGQELGRRMRDQMRHAARSGTKMDAWQLDEVLGEASNSRSVRDFMTGVLTGLLNGRPQLGDKPVRGIVHIANSALALAGQSMHGEEWRFWTALDKASFRVAGEEYPDFSGNPTSAADSEASGERQLYADQGVRRRIAEKYVAELSPGYRLSAGLGGNVNGMSRGQVNRWRDAYMEERARIGTAGFAEYNWRFGNNNPRVINDVLGEMKAALRREVKG